MMKRQLMSTRRHSHVLSVSLPLSLSLAIVAIGACGDDEPSGTGGAATTSTSSSGGMGGTGGTGGSGGSGGAGIIEPAGTSLFVEILDAAGDTPIPAAAVTAGGTPLPTNGAGQLLLENMPPGRFAARVEAYGYAPANVVGDLSDGVHGGARARLFSLGTPIPFDTTVDADVADPTGTLKLHLPAGALLTPDGLPVTGTAEATFVLIDPTTQGTSASPAPLEGTAAGGAAVNLDSYSIAEISIWQNNNRLVLKPGTYAALELVVPDALAGQVSIGKPLSGWVLDLDQGLWREEANGAIQDSTLQPGKLAWIGYLPHLSWWTDAEPWEDKNCFNVTFLDANNVPYSGQKITPVPLSFTGAPATPYTDAAGHACVNIKLNNSAALTAGNDASSPLADKTVTGVGPPSACGGMGAACAPAVIQTPAINICTPGAKQEGACPYSGPAATENVGLCHAGERFCNADGTAWLDCAGEVLPAAQESCDDIFDGDCDGLVNEDGINCTCVPGTVQSGGCYFGDPSTLGVGVCQAGSSVCNSRGTGYECQGEVHPTTEICTTTEDENCDAKSYCTFWSRRFGGTPNGIMWDMEPDGAGNTLITGELDNGSTIDFGNGALTATALYNLFLVKLGPSGETLWSKIVGGANETHGASVKSFGPANDILLTGWYLGTLDFGNGVPPLPTTTLTASYVAKLDANGNALWNRAYDATFYDSGTEIAIDAGGNIILGGRYTGTMDFGNGIPVLTTTGDFDYYVAKLASDGTPLWARSFGNATTADLNPYIAVDGAGDVLITGVLSDTIDFGGGLPQLTSMGAQDVFVAKLSGATGASLWAQGFGDAVGQSPFAIAVDGSNNAVIAGLFSGTVDFGNGTGALTDAGGGDIFIAKLAPSGSAVWSKRFGDGGTQGADSVAIDGMNNILVTGFYFGSLDFNDGTVWTAAGTDTFLVKLDAGGNTLWSKGLGPGATLYSASVARDATNNVLLAGTFTGLYDFGNGPLTAVQAPGDFFVAKLAP